MTGDVLAWLTTTIDDIDRTIRAERHDPGNGPLCMVDLIPEVDDESCSCGLGARRAEVLASIGADRAVLAELASWWHYYNDSDSWYSCAQAVSTWREDQSPGSGCADGDRAGGPCDCTVDDRRERLHRMVATRYRHRPGYLDEWNVTA